MITIPLEQPTDPDAVAADCETLEEWREELAGLSDDELHLDVRRGGPGWAIPDAVRAVMEVFGETNVAVCVHVNTERQALAAKEVIEERPPLDAIRFAVGNVIVEIRDADLISVRADVLVNASNTQLKLGAGVSGALARVCGPGLQQELWARAPIGLYDLVETSAHDLQTVRRLLHVPTASGSEEVVERAYQNILRRCADQGYKSVGVPALGSGTGGLSLEKNAALLLRAIVLEEHSFPDGLLLIVALLRGRGRDDFGSVFSASKDAALLTEVV